MYPTLRGSKVVHLEALFTIFQACSCTIYGTFFFLKRKLKSIAGARDDRQQGFFSKSIVAFKNIFDKTALAIPEGKYRHYERKKLQCGPITSRSGPDPGLF